MERYPDNISFTFAGKEVEYKKGYVGLKYPIIKHNTFHYSSCFKSHNNFWYRFETLHPTSIRCVITLQDAMVLGRISCVIYLCLSLLSAYSESGKKKERKKRTQKKSGSGIKSKCIEIEKHLKQTSYVQLVAAADQIAFYREYDRNADIEPSKPENHPKKLQKSW